MTKVRPYLLTRTQPELIRCSLQLFAPVAKDYGINWLNATGKELEEKGVINQRGLNRKVSAIPLHSFRFLLADCSLLAYLRLGEGESRTSAARLHRSAAV